MCFSANRKVYLQDEINTLTKKYKDIKEVYLFGSRAYETGCYRSDIDLLVVADRYINLHEEYIVDESIDLFFTINKQDVTNYMNGSRLNLNHDKYNNIIDQIDAILLWDSSNKFHVDNINKYNIQTMRTNVKFEPSVLPNYSESKNNLYNEYKIYLNQHNIIDTSLGFTTFQVLDNISKLIKNSIEHIEDSTCKFKTENLAKNINKNSFLIDSEYDFQNYIHLSLKPWIPSLKRESFVISIFGNNKNVDFSLSKKNNLIIEVKYIKNTNTKNEIQQDILALKNFYELNPTVEGLLFLVLYDNAINLDIAQYSDYINDNRTKICFIENKFKSKENEN